MYCIRIGALDIYKFCDYLPVFSIATNGITLIAKAVFDNQESATKDSFKAYVLDKLILRCVILIFVPILGNLVFAIYDLASKCKSTTEPRNFTFNSVSLTDETTPYHAILRSEQYACLFDCYTYGNIETGKRNIKIIDLATKETIKTFKCGANERILCFKAPYVVTLHRKNGCMKIWDIRNQFAIPEETISTGLEGVQRIQRGDIQGNMLAFTWEDATSWYITIYKNIDPFDKSKITSFPIEHMDDDSPIAIDQDRIVYSSFGCPNVITLATKEYTNISATEASLESYFKELSEATEETRSDIISTKYEPNVIKNIVFEKDKCIGITRRAIKIWNISEGTLEKEIETKEALDSCTLDGRFLVGHEDSSRVSIWDIANGRLLHTIESVATVSSAPPLTLYRNTIYRIANKSEIYPNVTVSLSAEV